MAMPEPLILAFDAGGAAVKAALYDGRGRELAVAGVTIKPLRPAPGFLERDPQALWASACAVARQVLSVPSAEP